MEKVYLCNMFPDYEPPEALNGAFSQAAIVAADIDPESRRVSVAVHSETYIPQRLLNQTADEICRLYGLRHLELTATHPETELQKVEQEELMMLFVSRNSKVFLCLISSYRILACFKGLLVAVNFCYFYLLQYYHGSNY